MLLLFSVVCVWTTTVFALTPKSEKGVKVLTSPSLSYESPDRFTPFSLEEAPEELSYWVALLPYEEDRNDDVYIVLPTLWLISPVAFVPEESTDRTNMVLGKEIDINKYLVEGVMHYPKSGIPGEAGNPVIFWHSNFFKDGQGKYKTIFADIMNLDVDVRDEMRVYIREEGEEDYELRKFEITESYETVPTDVAILRPKGGKELTVFACTNGLAGRWILRGKYIENNEILVPYAMKFRWADLIELLEDKDTTRQKATIVIMLNKIKQIEEWLPVVADRTSEDKMKHYLLEYFKTELSAIY